MEGLALTAGPVLSVRIFDFLGGGLLVGALVGSAFAAAKNLADEPEKMTCLPFYLKLVPSNTNSHEMSNSHKP